LKHSKTASLKQRSELIDWCLTVSLSARNVHCQQLLRICSVVMWSLNSLVDRFLRQAVPDHLQRLSLMIDLGFGWSSWQASNI